MITAEKVTVTVEAKINASVEKTWKLWTLPVHIMHWNQASDDWQTTRVENDLRPGGRFNYRMEAKEGNPGFDFSGAYTRVTEHHTIEYTMDDGRKVMIAFIAEEDYTRVRETFETETENPVEMQQQGWQAILDHFKKYAESVSEIDPLHFEIIIEAPIDKVYRTMIGENSYPEWTNEFNPGSNFRGSWEKGSKILFTGTGEEGKITGMVSHIKENMPNRFVSIEHRGMLQGDTEITSGPEVDIWAGALENYTFTEMNGKTKVSVDMDSAGEFNSFMMETWPKALKKLKEICES